MKFVIYKPDGEIVGVGDCPAGELAAQCPPGCLIMEGSADISADAVDAASGLVVPGGRPAVAIDMDYRAARSAAYPPVNEQLDMIWKAMDEAPAKRLEPFYSYVKAIKDAYPKDNSVAPGSVIIYTAE